MAHSMPQLPPFCVAEASLIGLDPLIGSLKHRVCLAALCRNADAVKACSHD